MPSMSLPILEWLRGLFDDKLLSAAAGPPPREPAFVIRYGGGDSSMIVWLRRWKNLPAADFVVGTATRFLFPSSSFSAVGGEENDEERRRYHQLWQLEVYPPRAEYWKQMIAVRNCRYCIQYRYCSYCAVNNGNYSADYREKLLRGISYNFTILKPLVAQFLY